MTRHRTRRLVRAVPRSFPVAAHRVQPQGAQDGGRTRVSRPPSSDRERWRTNPALITAPARLAGNI